MNVSPAIPLSAAEPLRIRSAVDAKRAAEDAKATALGPNAEKYAGQVWLAANGDMSRAEQPFKERKFDGGKANVNAFLGVKDVGSFEEYANHWGICDMHGNVREWCADIYKLYDTTEVIAADPLAADKGYNGRHVVRGGHCREDEERCTCASRSAGKVDKYTGFRICCTSLP